MSSVLLDLVEAYEFFRHQIWAQKCREVGLPLYYARWCLVTYGGPRVLKLEGACSEIFRVNTSIVAGCAGATTMLRAMLLQACDEVVGECPRVRLKVVVDDISLQALGSPSSVVNQIGRATNLLVSR